MVEDVQEADMGRHVALCLISIAGLSVAVLSQPAQAARERLFYEIVETSSDSRNQNWHGVLYEKDGK
jgi:hypothetical protein